MNPFKLAVKIAKIVLLALLAVAGFFYILLCYLGGR